MKVTLAQKMYALVAFVSFIMLFGTGIAYYGLHRAVNGTDTLIQVDVAQEEISLGAQVDLGEHVAVEDDDRVLYAARRIADGTGCTKWGRLDHVPDSDARVPSGAEHLFDAARLIVQTEDDLVDFGHPLDEIQLIVEKRAVEYRNDALGCVDGERAEPRALSSDQKKRLHIEA